MKWFKENNQKTLQGETANSLKIGHLTKDQLITEFILSKD